MLRVAELPVRKKFREQKVNIFTSVFCRNSSGRKRKRTEVRRFPDSLFLLRFLALWSPNLSEISIYVNTIYITEIKIVCAGLGQKRCF